MQYLLEHDELAQRLYRGNPKGFYSEERYKYIQANGIQVFGVVVTGPFLGTQHQLFIDFRPPGENV